MNLSIDKIEVSEGVVRLTVAGEVDLATYDQLLTAIEASLSDLRPAKLIVDLDQVSFLDSTGIHALIRGYELATGRGIGYVVANTHGTVRRVLDIAGVLSLLTQPVGSVAGELAAS